MTYKDFLVKFSKFLNIIGLRRLQKHIKVGLFRLIGWALGSKTVALPDKSQIENILIVKQDHQMGDMLCATPIFTALREAFPEAYITLIAGQKNYHVVRNHPALSEVIFFNKLEYLSSPKGWLAFYRKLHERPYDLGIVPATVSVSVTSDMICRLSGAPYRLGVKKLDGKENPTSFLFNLPLELDWREKPIHQSQRNLEILHGLDIFSENTNLSTGTTPEEDDFAETFFNKNLPGKKTAIGFHPGAGKAGNLWGAEKFAQAANALAAQFDARIFITCGPDDLTIVEQMTRHLNAEFVVCSGLSIGQIAALLRKMTLYIANDTGTMHLAAAMNTPTLAIFGPTDPVQWAPLGDQHRCVRGEKGELAAVTVESVLSAAQEMMQAIK